ncbi:DUF6397 family protein [Streptomyces sp. NPDC002232]|uniref:DUF6397 family protein n=1 Tax=Streptomyces sp. NPDC002232 TaxID=3364640 RepID=UPI0036A19D52
MVVDERTHTVTPGRAARELELRQDEFRLAVLLGLVRTVSAGEGDRRRIERAELDRLRAAPDFPAGLRERVRTVGTGEAAALLGITAERFTRLARTGHLSPVRFSLNRYRMVVWRYLAQEVVEFGLTRPDLLRGRLPQELRERLAAHVDRRPRNWRTRRLGLLLRDTGDPWTQAAAIASLLDPVQLAEVVDDPYERAYLDRLRPPPPPGMPVSPISREIAERLALADDPDELLWHRLSLALALDEARAERQAPHPGELGETGCGRPAGGPVSAGREAASAAWAGVPAGRVAGRAEAAAVPVAGSVTSVGSVASVGSETSVGSVASVEPVPALESVTSTERVADAGPGAAAEAVTRAEPIALAEPVALAAPGEPAAPVSLADRWVVGGGRSGGRAVRARLLERLRRGRARDASRPRRPKRPAGWP